MGPYGSKTFKTPFIQIALELFQSSPEFISTLSSSLEITIFLRF